MTEKRYEVKGSDDFFLHIEDTTLNEDKHEGAIYDIYEVTRRLNEQDKQIKELQCNLESRSQDDYIEYLKSEIEQLKKTLRIIADAESVRDENSVKEILRNYLFGLDTVTGESFNAYQDYTLLNKFFKEYYGECWDNDKYD